MWGRRRLRPGLSGRADPVLDPLLGAVASVPPPEGLLHDVERRIAQPDPAPRRSRPFGMRLAGASALAAGVVAGVFYLVVPDPVRLTDPSGRTVATLTRGQDTTVAHLATRHETDGAPMSWHLWGIAPGREAPAPLGALAPGGLAIRNASQFTHFAISLEPADFAGSLPTGPVIPLQREKK